MNNILYAITDVELLPGDALFRGVEASLIGGCRWVQYRNKSIDQDLKQREASQLVTLCNRYDAKLIINDDIKLAQRTHAHGVHLGQEDGSPKLARQILGDNFIIGVTCHDSLDLAKQALDDGANYIAFGRFFPSSTKPHASPAPIALLREARTTFKDALIVAIGGITLANAQPLLDAGANKIAVSHGLFATHDIALQASQFNQLKPVKDLS